MNVWGSTVRDMLVLRRCIAVVLVLGVLGGGIDGASVTLSSCDAGAYSTPSEAVAPWKNGCPGWSECEPGFYCVGGLKYACPVGTYGSTSGLTAPECSGQCRAGYYCPQRFDVPSQLWVGSTSDTEVPCGGVGVYCPQGSATPTPVPPGFYSLNDRNALPSEADRVAQGLPFVRFPTPDASANANVTRTSIVTCPLGHYCVGGILAQCPGGTYGSAEGMSTPTCSGQCEEGFYCPAGSTSAREVGCGEDPEYFCPAGSMAPQPVCEGDLTEVSGGQGGFYTVGSSLDESSLTSSARVTQELCPLGHYCVDGIRYLCPAGRYGGTRGLISSTCTGQCTQGYYCPAGSSVTTQIPCGDNDVYCPAGSGAPTPVSTGYYTVGLSPGTRFEQRQCEPGFWCQGGERYHCRQGHYGATPGAATSDCDGVCESGYYCPPGSTSPTQTACGGPGLWCPEGSEVPLPVYDGYYTVRVLADALVNVAASSVHVGSGTEASGGSGQFAALGVAGRGTVGSAELEHPQGLAQFNSPQYHVFAPDTSTAASATVLSSIGIDSALIRNYERRCDEGHYCVAGERLECPPGTYGDERGLNSSSCSGQCSQGYICPTASTRRDQIDCGSAAMYCPTGSFTRTPVTQGYYTTGGTELTRYAQSICEPGYYCDQGIKIPCPPGVHGATYGLSTPECSGKCEPGYYCPEASVSPTQIACGNFSVFCPEGSREPLPVKLGWYTAGGRHTERPDSSPMECRVTYEELNKPENLVAPVHVPFNESRFCTSGLIGDANTRSTQVQCEPGHFCVDGLRYECPPGRYGSTFGVTDPQCTGECRDGWYCPWASTSREQAQCGDPGLYCPASSGFPTPVTTGYYTVPDRNTTIRNRQTICEPGHWCSGGIRDTCKSGKYGATPGLFSAECSGACAPGYYCPEVSTSARERECGDVGVYCPGGSSLPTPIESGWYTVGGYEEMVDFGDNTTRVWKRICPAGHYCEGGRLIVCPAGVWGNDTGMSTPQCTAPCPEGFFCPPGSVNATMYRCGDVFVNYGNDLATHTTTGLAVGGGTAGAGASGQRQDITDPALLIPWYSGHRAKLPAQEVHLDSFASIHTFNLHGGVSSVYCPEGSGWPTFTKRGFYSVGGTANNYTRSDQTKCETGYFCVGGRKFPCPPGTYGETKGLVTRYCTKPCPEGFYCPMNSTVPTECPYNHYATEGLASCIACPTAPAADSPHTIPRCKTSRFCCNY